MHAKSATNGPIEIRVRARDRADNWSETKVNSLSSNDYARPMAATSEAICRALYANGAGLLHTVDPYGAEIVPPILRSWPREGRLVRSPRQ